tara:strand:+ start:53 stop:1075 length:1023 start_codon:yes stop_codon:yes gene_type:complete
MKISIISDEKHLWSLLGCTRFFLSMIVLLQHSSWAIPDSQLKEWVSNLGSYEAVYGFLIISGFSIARSIEKKESGFYTRRFLRIYPIYFIGLSFAFILYIILGKEVKMEDGLLLSAGYFTYLANYAFLQTFICIAASYNTPLWTLSIEVFYYFISPFLNKYSFWILMSIVLISLVIHIIPIESYIYGYPAASLGWLWILGFLFGKNQKNKIFVNLISCILLVLIPLFTDIYRFGYQTLLIILPIFVICFSHKIKLPVSFLKLFNYLGDLSYPLYIFHFPVFILINGLNLSNNLIFLVIASLICAVLGDLLIDRFFNKKFLKPIIFSLIEYFRLKDRVRYL